MTEVKETSGGGSIGCELMRESPKVLTAGDRKLLRVELRPADTTYVSWKKLMREASKVNGLSSSVPDPPPNANPNLESRLAPGHPAEIEADDQPHSNRFNAVIEKIERLYKGNDSSDGEELDGAPDDDEYDSEDSFIDDAELDDYFEVDNSAVKHDGFYVNRGKLERIEPSATSNQQPKRRRRKDSVNSYGDTVDQANKQTKLSITARRKVKDQSTASGSSLKRKYTVARKTQESPLHFGSKNVNASLSMVNVKISDKTNHQLVNATSHKLKETGSSNLTNHHINNNKSLHQQSNSLPGREATVIHQKENNGVHDLINATGSRQLIQATKRAGSNVKPKISTLEKAIRELEKVVAQSRPPAATENQEADTSSQAVKRRLPREVKLNLAKVARIAASQGKLSVELINRLMSIVGHLIQLRSLKRNLKIMIDMGDSANREKDTRFQRINNEVLEMIKAKVSLMESQATKQNVGPSSDDFQDTVEKPSLKKFVMDAALEDKLCDLYDIFVDGLDEDPGPQIRKLYANLAQLWPDRLMDNHGIKRAICRAKERQRALDGSVAKEMDETKIKKRRKQLAPRSDWTSQPSTTPVFQLQHTGEKTAVDSSLTTQPMVDSSRDRSNQQHEKLKGSSSSCNPTEETKVVKRKTEIVVAEKQVVLALKKQEHPQARVLAAPQNPNIPETPLDLNLPS